MVSGEIVVVADFEESFSKFYPEEKELLAAALLAQLSAESKSKILNKELGESGLIVVVGGSNCSIKSEINLQIQSASNLGYIKILEALAQRIKG